MNAEAHSSQAAHSRWWTLTLMVVGIFMSTMDIFIVNVAIPPIKHGLSASDADLQLIIAIYTLCYGVMLITGSRLGDRFGRKAMFLLGVGGFTLASLFCGLATQPAVLIGARAMQGIGSALMVPQVLPTIHHRFAPEERQKALGIYGAAIGLGAMVGQLVGGMLVAANLFGLGWRLVFLINVPVGVAIVIMGLRVLANSYETQPKRLDLAGVFLLTTTLALFMYPLIISEGAHWEPWMFVLMLGAAATGTFFARVERWIAARGGFPLVHAELFRARAYTPAMMALALAQGGLAAFIFVYTMHMQLGLGFSALAVGASLGSPAIGYTIASLATARLVKRWGDVVAPAGGVLMVIGYGAVFMLAAAAGEELKPQAIVLPVLVAAIGRGMMFTPTINVALRKVKAEQVGMASGVLNTSFQLGNLLGISLIGSVFLAVRHFAIGSSTHSSTVAFVVASGLIFGASALSCYGSWRAQRSARSEPTAGFPVGATST